jgi:hypothetical protein
MGKATINGHGFQFTNNCPHQPAMALSSVPMISRLRTSKLLSWFTKGEKLVGFRVNYLVGGFNHLEKS